MSDPARFLQSFAQVLGVAGLYPEGHPFREKAVDAAFEELTGLPVPTSFTFLEDEVVFNRERLRGLRAWDWGRRLVAAGIERIEVERHVNRDEFSGFLEEVSALLAQTTVAPSEARQMRSLGIRFGPVEVLGRDDAETSSTTAATLDVALGEEAETFRWLMAQVQSNDSVPLLEAEAVVRSLSVAMCADSPMLLPLLKLKEYDQYTTTHALNVAVLSMGLAETLGYRSYDVRSIGVAGLLHDVGKIRVPIEVLTKPGALSREEREIMNRHPVDGATLLMQSHDDLGLAATVAYEHHIQMHGEGYPPMHYRRTCSQASRLVQVCDIFDALSTDRPYRAAWPTDRTLAYLEERSGIEFEPELVAAFVRTLRLGRAHVRVLTNTDPIDSRNVREASL